MDDMFLYLIDLVDDENSIPQQRIFDGLYLAFLANFMRSLDNSQRGSDGMTLFELADKAFKKQFFALFEGLGDSIEGRMKALRQRLDFPGLKPALQATSQREPKITGRIRSMLRHCFYTGRDGIFRKHKHTDLFFDQVLDQEAKVQGISCSRICTRTATK